MMITPHFGIFNPPPRPRSAANSNADADPVPGTSGHDDPDRYSRIERDLVLLTHGDGAHFIATPSADEAKPERRRRRFIGAAMPPYF
jgi:hypothetical protein